MKDATDSAETADAVMAVAVVDGTMVADAATTVVCGSSCFCAAAVDSAMVVATDVDSVMTVVCGSFCFCAAAVDSATVVAMVADAAMVVAMVADAAMVVVVAMVAAVRQFLSNVWRFRDGVNTPSLFLCFLAYSAYISHIYL